MPNELTPEVVKYIAREFGYVTNGQATNIKEACEHYIAGKTISEAVIEVTGECEHDWVAFEVNPVFGPIYKCTKCGDVQ